VDNYQNNEYSIESSEVINNIQLQFKPEDFNNYEVTGNDGCNYFLYRHKSKHLLFFAKIAENTRESQSNRHCILVDGASTGRYLILEEDHETEMKSVPAEFVREKYSQAMYYFSVCEYLKSKLHGDKLWIKDLESEINSHLIRLVKLLIHDMENIDHIDRAIDNEISLTIHNITDNNDKFISDLMNIDDDGKWLYLKFNSNSYYLDESDGLQDNDNVLYYMAFHKSRKHVIFVRAAAQELEINKTTLHHHLYISEDDGLGRYKVQSKDSEILKQFFVPAGYVEGWYNRFIELSNDFKKLHLSDVYSRQTNWCNLQDGAIYFINRILDQIKNDLKQEIEKSLEHYVMSMSSSIGNPRNFDDFYKKVVEREKRIRLQNRENTHSSSLIIFNKRNRTTFIIHMSNFENDIFYLDEKIRILISKYAPDYYVVVDEAWMPKNHEIQQRISSNYRHGNITKLPSHEKIEILTFIAKTKNSINRGPDKLELYEIVREKQSDENSRIVELRKISNGGLDFGMEFPNRIGS
jgi:hypothetical protein